MTFQLMGVNGLTCASKLQIVQAISSECLHNTDRQSGLTGKENTGGRGWRMNGTKRWSDEGSGTHERGDSALIGQKTSSAAQRVPFTNDT